MEAIIRFEKPVTMVTDKAITMAGFNWTVTARAEQIPNTCTVIGFSSFNGFVSNFRYLEAIPVNYLGCLK